jgi:hypothetical protein
VGQNPEPEKILRDFLIDLVDNERKDNERKSILANGTWCSRFGKVQLR